MFDFQNESNPALDLVEFHASKLKASPYKLSTLKPYLEEIKKRSESGHFYAVFSEHTIHWQKTQELASMEIYAIHQMIEHELKKLGYHASTKIDDVTVESGERVGLKFVYSLVVTW